MSEEKSVTKFFVYCVIILLLLLSMVKIVFSFGGLMVRGELLVMLFLILLSLIGLFAYQKCWGERVFFFTFLISIANLVFIWIVDNNLFIVPLFLSLIGFLMSIPKKVEEEDGEFEEPEVLEKKEVVDPQPVQKEVLKKENKKAETKFVPGKFVASSRSNIYHAPTCEWAKKINPKGQLWFKDKREAGRKKYKPHNCVK